jgi:RNA polymerase sigma-70 factor, ECF subfamily
VTESLASLETPDLVEAMGAPRESAAGAEDECLLEGLRQGAESAYETLIQRYQQPVFSLVSRLLRDPDEACDVVQEVFLKVFRKIASFRGDSSLKTWIYRIAVNETNNHCRWNGRHRRQEVDLEGCTDHGRSVRDTLPAPGRSPFDYVLDRERQGLIEAALADLNPTFRSVVVLRDVEDLSYEEIAAILQVPLGTVKSRILRGRDALRRELETRLESEPGFRLMPQTVE